jgi:hypothetical protein
MRHRSITSQALLGACSFTQRLILTTFGAVLVVGFLMVPLNSSAESEEPLAPGVNRYWHSRAVKIAETYGLGDVFVRQMMQESGFSDDVIYGQTVSWAGAQGIAQIMVSHHPTVNPLRPEEALRYAARHMLDLLVRYNGSISKALSAYNAGAGNVDWAVEQGGNNWREFLPDETKHYIEVITRSNEPDIIKGWPELGRWWSARSDVVGSVLPMAAEPY